MLSVELFAGAGGLAIGMANAGFQHAAVVEWNHDACETFRENQRHHDVAMEKSQPVRSYDVRGGFCLGYSQGTWQLTSLSRMRLKEPPSNEGPNYQYESIGILLGKGRVEQLIG